MQEISVTIGIPIYNVESCVAMSFKSALDQSYNNIYYILIDDCGSDKSMDIVSSIINSSTKESCIKIIKHPRNLGLGEARNTIIRNASTDYIYFMDSDDTIESDAIEILVRKASENSFPDIVIANHITEYIDGKKETVDSTDTDLLLEGNDQILSYYSGNNIRLSSWNKLYKRTFLFNNNIKYVNRYHEDYFFSLQELHFAESILIVPNLLYHYIIRNNSITGGLKVSETTVDRLLLVLSSIYDYLSNNQINAILYTRKYVDFIAYIAYISFSIHHHNYNQIIKSLDIYEIDKSNVTYGYLNLLGKGYYFGKKLPLGMRLLYLKLLFGIVKLKRKD